MGFSGLVDGVPLVATDPGVAGVEGDAAVAAVCAELEELLAQPVVKRAPVERHAPMANGSIRCRIDCIVRSSGACCVCREIDRITRVRGAVLGGGRIESLEGREGTAA